MKKNPRSMRIPPHGVKKFLHQMKFTLLFVMLFCFYAEASSQKVTLKVKNMDLYSVLLQLKNQTGVRQTTQNKLNVQMPHFLKKTLKMCYHNY